MRAFGHLELAFNNAFVTPRISGYETLAVVPTYDTLDMFSLEMGLPPDPDSVSEGFKLLEELLGLDPDVKVIVLTGQNDHANALRAVGLGAYDFFAKPFDPDLLGLTIDRA